MLRLSLALAVLTLAACSSPPRSVPDVMPDRPTAGMDAPDYTRDVRPVLEAKAALGADAAYDWASVLAAGPSGFIVPFDAEGSLMMRFVRDGARGMPLPFPGLRGLSADELALVERWIEGGARDDGAVAFADAEQLLLAGVQAENHVAVIDAESLRLIRRIYFDDHGLPSAPYGPHHFAFEPDGSAAYVSLVSAGVVAKVSLDLTLDPSAGAALLAHTAPGAFATPGMLYTDGEDTLFIGRSTLSDPLATGLGMLDLAGFSGGDQAPEVIATPFNVPHALAVTPDGHYVLTAELTGTQAGSRAAVYDTRSGDLALTTIPAVDTPHELIHFSILGAHHAGMMGPPNPDMGPGHDGMGHDMSGGYPYKVTLTSRSTDQVIFLTLAEDGELILASASPAGDGPYHAHANHDGSALLIPNQFADRVTILDPTTRQVRMSVDASAPAGPLSQPHSPAPSLDGSRFFVTSSNLDGAWTPEFTFLAPPNADGTRDLLPPERAGNVAVFDAEGALLEVIQLGAYPSGLEPVFRSGVGDHDGMDHGGMDHGGMNH